MTNKPTLDSRHFFYVAFFEAPKIKSLNSLIEIFGKNKKAETFDFRAGDDNAIRLAVPLELAYGEDSVMEASRITIRGKEYYLYNFYMTRQVVDRKTIYSISFPYKALSNYIEERFFENDIERVYHVPVVENILDHIRYRGENGLSRKEKQGYLFDIIKYSARVKESATAKKVSLAGESPLNSTIYDVLSRDTRFKIIPLAMKLKSVYSKIGEFELSFDKLGNYRFWLRRDAQPVALPMLTHTFEYLWETGSVGTSEIMASKSYLEDDE